MIFSPLLLFKTNHTAEALIYLGIGIGCVSACICTVKMCIIWERRQQMAQTNLDAQRNVRAYGATGLDQRIFNFREDQRTMPPNTFPETMFHEVLLSPPRPTSPLSPSSLTRVTGNTTEGFV